MAGYVGTAMSSFHTGGQIGVAGTNAPTFREHVLPERAYVQGIETPVLATIGREWAGSVKFEMIFDKIDLQYNTNADVEFKDWTAVGTQAGDLFGIRAWNYTMIHSRPVAVSDSERTQGEYGVPDEYYHQKWKQALGVGVDFEHRIIWSRVAAGVGDAIDAGTPRKTHGIVAWAYDTGRVAGNITIPTTGGSTIPDFYSSTYFQGTNQDITRPQLISKIMQPFWSKGGELERSLAFVGPKVKNVIDEYSMIYSGSGATLSATPLNERPIPPELATIIHKLDIYQGTWGTLYVVKNRNMDAAGVQTAFGPSGQQSNIDPTTSMFIFMPRYCALAVKQPITAVDLPKLGHGTVGRIVGELGLYMRNPRALAFAHDIAA